MTLRRWTILSVILLVPGFVLQFLSRTVFVPEAGVIGGTAAGGGPCDPVVRDPLPGVRGTSAAFSRRILQILRKQVGLG